MKKILIIVTFLVGLIIITSYINQLQPLQTDSSSKKIKLGYIPIADCAQLYIAKEKGYFKEQGLDIELIKFTGGAKVLEALAGNSIDIGFSNVVSLILANNAGLDFKAVSPGVTFNTNNQASGLIALKNSNINSLKDLEGKRIAINTKKNIVELFMIQYLKKNNVDVSKIDFVEIPFPQMLQVLESKQVDAIATVEPFVSFSKKNGKNKVLGHFFSETMPELEVATYDASNQWIMKNLNTVESLNLALQKASIFANRNPDELRTIIAKYTKLEIEHTKSMVVPYFNSELNQKSLSAISDMVYQMDWTNKVIDTNDIIYKY